MPIEHRKYRKNSCSAINTASSGVFDCRGIHCKFLVKFDFYKSYENKMPDCQNNVRQDITLPQGLYQQKGWHTALITMKVEKQEYTSPLKQCS